MSKLYIDVGSTYFKIKDQKSIRQYFRDFNKNIFDDLMSKCGDIIKKYQPKDIYICSSANGGLSTLIIALTNSFSLKYATNIAYNSGINIIQSVLYPKLKEYAIPSDLIDVVIIVGGIDDIENVFDEDLIDYLQMLKFSNIVYAGSKKNAAFFKKNISNIKILPNIIDNNLHIKEKELKNYLTNLYQADIIGKEEIKELYHITENQIYSTPYIVNKTLPLLHKRFPQVVDPFILIDIGGATTDIHYSTDLVRDNLVIESGYDRVVFKKLGVYKSKESLIFSAKQNEYVYELLSYLDVTENILEQTSNKATKVLMQLSIFLVLYKVSFKHPEYVTLQLERLKSLVFTGGITKVLSVEDIEKIVHFVYKKLYNYHHIPLVILDKDYEIWTLREE